MKPPNKGKPRPTTPTPTYPPFAGSVALDANWRATRSNYQSWPVTVTPEGLSVEIPAQPETANYIWSPALRGLKPGQTIEIAGEIRVTGSPVFHTTYPDGYGAPPNLRLFVWCWDLLFTGSKNSERMWAADYVKFAPGEFTLSAVLDAAAWDGLDPKYPLADFADALAHCTAVGFTCGGGDASGHGVSVTDGTAEIVVAGYQIR